MVCATATAEQPPDRLAALLTEVSSFIGHGGVMVAPPELAALAEHHAWGHVDLEGPPRAIRAALLDADLVLLSDSTAWSDLLYRAPLAAVSLPTVLLEAGDTGAFFGHVRSPGEPLREAAHAAENALRNATDYDRLALLAEQASALNDVVTAQRAALVDLSDLIRAEIAAVEGRMAVRVLQLATLERRLQGHVERVSVLAARMDRVRHRHHRRIRRLERDVASQQRVRRSVRRSLRAIRSRWT